MSNHLCEVDGKKGVPGSWMRSSKMASPAANFMARPWVFLSVDAAVRVWIWFIALDLTLPKVPATCSNIGSAQTCLFWYGQASSLLLYNITVFQDARSSQKNLLFFLPALSGEPYVGVKDILQNWLFSLSCLRSQDRTCVKKLPRMDRVWGTRLPLL